MAVWLIDARGLSALVGRVGGRSLRRTRVRGTAPTAGSARGEPLPERRFEPLLPPAAEQRRDVATMPVGPGDATGTVAHAAVEASPEPLPAPSPTGPRGGKRVPAAYTAIEGSYRDVARVPIWRKLVSLASLLGILLVIGVTIAALAGATFGAVAELVDGAIG